MFGVSSTELVIIGLFAFLLFGPDKLPQMGRTVGRALKQFKAAQEEVTDVLRKEVYDPLADLEPLANPLEGLFDTAKKDDKTAGAEGDDKTDKASAPAQADKTVAGVQTGLAPVSTQAASVLKTTQPRPENAQLSAETTAVSEAAAQNSAVSQIPVAPQESFAEKRARLAREAREREAHQNNPQRNLARQLYDLDPVDSAQPADSTQMNTDTGREGGDA